MEVITSFFETVKERTRNPFFATLIGVWFVRNWDLVYTLFNFDEPCTLGEKKNFILTYYNDKVWYQELGINILYAFGLMIIAYVLIIISRLIVNVTDHNIIPRMNDKTVSKLVVNKDLYNTVKTERNNYYNQLEDEREKTIKLEQKFANLKIQLSKNEDESLANKEKFEKNQSTLTQVENELEKIKNGQEKAFRDIEKLSENKKNLESNISKLESANRRLITENLRLNNSHNDILLTEGERDFKDLYSDFTFEDIHDFYKIIQNFRLKNKNDSLNEFQDKLRIFAEVGLVSIKGTDNLVKDYDITNKGNDFYSFLERVVFKKRN